MEAFDLRLRAQGPGRHMLKSIVLLQPRAFPSPRQAERVAKDQDMRPQFVDPVRLDPLADLLEPRIVDHSLYRPFFIAQSRARHNHPNWHHSFVSGGWSVQWSQLRRG